MVFIHGTAVTGSIVQHRHRYIQALASTSNIVEAVQLPWAGKSNVQNVDILRGKTVGKVVRREMSNLFEILIHKPQTPQLLSSLSCAAHAPSASGTTGEKTTQMRSFRGPMARGQWTSVSVSVLSQQLRPTRTSNKLS